MKKKELSPEDKMRELIVELLTNYYIPEVMEHLKWAKKRDDKLMIALGRKILKK